MPGPVPKRSSQRRRRNTVQVDRISVRGPVEAPPLDLEDVHPLAAAMYEALARSAHAVYMEPSDWEYARWVAFVQSKAAQRPTAMMILAVDKMLSNLMVTEADRRRVRVEIDRTREDPAELAALDSVRELRARRERLISND
jgi:hypothetical protein